MTAKDTAKSVISRADSSTVIASTVIISSIVMVPYGMHLPEILLGAAIGLLLRGAMQK